MEAAGDETARVRLACKLWDLAIDAKIRAIEEGWWNEEVGSWDAAPSLPIVTMLGLGIRWSNSFPTWTYPST